MSVRLIICKKVLPFSLALALASSAVIAHAADLYGGDVNGDGRVNVTDLSKLAAYVKGVKPLDNSELAQADVNADRMVNVTDISLLADHIKSGGDESSEPQEKSDDAQCKELAKLTNAERSRLSLSELTYSDELAELAQIRAQELLEYFPTDAYHTRPDGSGGIVSRAGNDTDVFGKAEFFRGLRCKCSYDFIAFKEFRHLLCGNAADIQHFL